MIPKKLAPDLIRGGHRFSEKIMLQHKLDMIPKKLAPDSEKIMLWLVTLLVQRPDETTRPS
jgi:hypothetical protein